MRLALTQLMQSFHYGQRTLSGVCFRRLSISYCLLRLKQTCDHRSARQYGFITATTDSGAWQNAAFEGISMDCLGLASVRRPPAALLMLTVRKSRRCAESTQRWRTAHCLSWRSSRTFPGQAFWDKQGFQFEAFRPQVWMSTNRCRIFVLMLRWNF